METCILVTFFLTTLVLASQILSSAAAAAATSPAASPQLQLYSNFIKTSCNTTTYPSLCLKSLSPYASTVKTSPLKLSNAALTVTLKAANAASITVSKLAKQKGITKTEAAIIQDCIENIHTSIDELKQSLKAISGLSGAADKHFQISNAQTWTSAAITDNNTCTDGFSGRQVNPVVKSKIRNSIVQVARLSSNALYLINHLKY